jgi:Flp pilus assembly protein TadG
MQMNRVRRTLKSATRLIRSFAENRSGQFAIMTVAIVPALLVVVGLAVDVSQQSNKRSELQNVMDSAVIAGASLQNATDDKRILEAETYLKAALKTQQINVTAVNVTFTVDKSESIVGKAKLKVPLSFGNIVYRNQLQVDIEAEAEFKAPKLNAGCIHVLADVGQALLLNSGASIDAPTCQVNVHSRQNPAFIMNAGVTMNVSKLCVKGTNYIRNGGVLSRLETNCAVPPDPFAGLIPEPSVPAGCTTSGVYNPGTHVLNPGVHCAPTFNGSPTVTFQPGLHIIKGRMILNSGSTVIANGVTFYFPDTDSEIRANGALTMKASAPTSGTYAGILMFEKTSNAANNAAKRQYIFNGSNGEELEGAIYLPNRDVTYNSTTNVKGNKTTIVVNTMIVNSANWKLEGSGGGGGGAYIARLKR